MIALNGIPYTLLVAAFAGCVWTSAGPKRAARITGAMLIGYALTGMVTGGAIGWVLLASGALVAAFAPLTMYLYRNKN